MSERYTAKFDIDATAHWFTYRGDVRMKSQFVAEELNRLAAQVETLRELLWKSLPYVPRYGEADKIELAKRIDAALADTNQERGEEAARSETEE